VTGRNGTTLNGSLTEVVVSGVERGIWADMGEGDNTLQIGSPDLPTDLGAAQIITRNGIDAVTLCNVTVRNRASIQTRGGADSVSLIDVEAIRLDLVTGDGDDFVKADRSGLGRARIVTQRGRDTVRLSDTYGMLTSNVLRINTSVGDDTLEILGLTARNGPTIRTSGGNDGIRILDSIARGSKIFTGTDVDTLQVLRSDLGVSRTDINERFDLLEIMDSSL
jgi:hypothetical protein